MIIQERKEKEMKMKKSICVLAAAVMAASMMTACGGSDDSSKAESKQSQEQADDSSFSEEARMSASGYADELQKGITYVDQLNPISSEMIAKVYGVAEDKYTDAKVYVGGVSTAEEIACFDAVDEAAAADIKAACEARIAAQIKAVEGYNPDELPKLNDPVLIVSGRSVYMCLSNDNAKAKEILE